MTATDELRHLLDERGVKYEADDDVTRFFDADGVEVVLQENMDGKLDCLTPLYLTPAQAIAATLGRGECKPMTYDNGYSMDRVEPGEYYEFWEPACACSECGELIPMRRFCPNCGARIVDPTTNDVDAEVAR